MEWASKLELGLVRELATVMAKE
jgi:hypothetical protein